MSRWMVCIGWLLGMVALTRGYSVTFPTAPAAGVEGTTAIHMSSDSFVGWADSYTNLVYGEGVAPIWQTPAKGLGAAEGTSSDIVCLGRGGTITLIVSQGIADGDGFDFSVFENSFDDQFLELAWVEVSSDGSHFVRFPDFSCTLDPVDAFATVNPVEIYGYAGKYRQGYGTPFDLSELSAVSNSIAAGEHDLTDEYVVEFSANIPYLDFERVRYVRLVDVVGDGSCLDCEGYAIYDPYPTVGSAGFDLDALGVIHLAEPQSAVMPPEIALTVLDDAFLELDYSIDCTLTNSCSLIESEDLMNWSAVVSEHVTQETSGDAVHVTVHLPIEKGRAFFRLVLETPL